MAAANAVTMALGSLNFGLFIKPMGDDLGIGRSWFGWAGTAQQVATSATSPLIGRLVDRFGARLLLPLAALVTCGALTGLAFIHSAWQMVALFAVTGLLGLSGPGNLVIAVPVLKWFVRNRGKAIAFMSLGISVGAVIFLPLTQVFIHQLGWRHAWIALSIIGAVVIVPLALIFLRRQPEDMGMLPDGAPTPASHSPHGSATLLAANDEVSWTAHDAVRTGAFWRLVSAFSIISVATGLVGLHRIPAFTDRGLDASLISIATALDAVCAGVTVFTMGLLSRRFPGRYLGAVGFLFLAAATVLTIHATTTAVMFLSMAVFGMGIGGMIFLHSYIWADYFGRANLGGIRGIVTPVTLVIGGAGPPLAGYVFDARGSYIGIWWAGACLMLAAVVIVAFTVAPRRPSVHLSLGAAATSGEA
ncbi:MAG: MFS transporter [Dehalococcoidia bacterium]|nr:MFS transporter [Dehalococcoidia bacterium]MSQ34494.1 MFS transporter [Dehalococcoidia bacterium]